MTEPEFWKLIEDTRDELTEVHDENLVAALSKLPAKTILEFGFCWSNLSTRAYDWNLWGAAYVINGGCSDDGFMDFRTWLILEGEAIYKAALANPDSLADTNVQADEAGYQCYPANDAYAEADDAEEGVEYYEAMEKHCGPHDRREEPTGEDWDFEDQDEVQKRLPKLYKKFSDA
ncbi:hypothetical protein BH11PLA2_BH11PLA2_37990 [soil metagenome]